MTEKNKEVKETKEEVLDESAASETLHPNTRPVNDPKSKVEAITRVVGAMASMTKGDMIDFFNQSMAQIGKEAEKVPSSSEHNKSTINMKPSKAVGGGSDRKDATPKLDVPGWMKLSVKEDAEEMFAGEDLSEDFKAKALVIFEAAVNARAIAEETRLQEEYEEKLAAAIEEGAKTVIEELNSKVNSYLDYVVETWMEDNKVAIESTLRAEITNEFIDGLKKLFTEHYIEVPEEKVDVVEALTEKVEALEIQLNGTITENAKLKEAFVEVEKKEIVESYIADLALTERDKFIKLAEGVEFDGDTETYSAKLALVKENYFNKKTVTKPSNITEESFETDDKKDEVVDAQMARYAAAISRTVKR